jgi:hypothetical protein
MDKAGDWYFSQIKYVSSTMELAEAVLPAAFK